MGRRAAGCRLAPIRRTRQLLQVEPYSSHLAYVKERRSGGEADALLDEAMKNLPARSENAGGKFRGPSLLLSRSQRRETWVRALEIGTSVRRGRAALLNACAFVQRRYLTPTAAGPGSRP